MAAVARSGGCRTHGVPAQHAQRGCLGWQSKVKERVQGSPAGGCAVLDQCMLAINAPPPHFCRRPCRAWACC